MTKETWDLQKTIKIVDEPIEITLNQLGLELMVMNPVVLAYKDKRIVSFHRIDEIVLSEKRNKVHILELILNVEYVNVMEYRQFLVINMNTGATKYTDQISSNENIVFFPIVKTENQMVKEIIKRINKK
jgi:hypothetical protein